MQQSPNRRIIYEPDAFPRRVGLPQPDPDRWITPAAPPEREKAPAAPEPEKVPVPA